MNEKRVKEAEQNFSLYISEGLIKKAEFDNNIFQKYYENSLESLRTAEDLFREKGSSLWIIVTSYYSMFYIACAFVYKKGYKTQHKIVHKVINDSLIKLSLKDLKESLLVEYEEEKEKALSIAENLIDSFEYEKSKRSRFQYEMTEDIKKSKAKTSLARAKEFVVTFRKLIG